jgi:hypothetical protein
VAKLDGLFLILDSFKAFHLLSSGAQDKVKQPLTCQVRVPASRIFWALANAVSTLKDHVPRKFLTRRFPSSTPFLYKTPYKSASAIFCVFLSKASAAAAIFSVSYSTRVHNFTAFRGKFYYEVARNANRKTTHDG